MTKTWKVLDVHEGPPQYVADGNPPVYYPIELLLEGEWDLWPGDVLGKLEPGVMHPVDQAFYDLTVQQRDRAWRRVEELEAELSKRS